MRPAAAPCRSCPYRRDVPSGVWDASEYAKLPPYDRETGDQPISLFMCHQQDGHLCAGWVGCHDMVESLAVRLVAATGELSISELDSIYEYESPVDLFTSGTEAANHGLDQVEAPPPEAVATIQRLKRKQRR